MIDIIIIDNLMPIKNGIEASNEIFDLIKNENFKNVIIFLNSNI